MTPDLPLTRLAAFVRQQTIAPEPLTGIGGTVSDVSRSSIAVRGLSRDARLGDTVAIRAGVGGAEPCRNHPCCRFAGAGETVR
ncbi:hypothetical protein BMEII1106 [Brucella melitensis bv. 1 str. 16M]|uniref:Flagellum-specific ATP synthase n=1 Tax=Brucella melitensis biotype 1 (strain ATCC 23456 / CCUG 17765 / NCTC 10094 / 16M) TaxID=224914 RepID=Q8YAZ5_BRUME|nr:hypothetical protein BMEII1106 [Brucella melitensis bv. 1 str. 16M]